MSETEAYTGTLTPVDMGGRSLEQYIEYQLNALLPDEKYAKEYVIFEFLYRKYYYDHTSETLYKIDMEPFDPEGFLNYTKNSDGTIDFQVSWYNGGASFDEAIEDIFQ